MPFSDDEMIITKPMIVNRMGETFDKSPGRKGVRFVPDFETKKSIIPKTRNKIPMVLEIFISSLYVTFYLLIKQKKGGPLAPLI